MGKARKTDIAPQKGEAIHAGSTTLLQHVDGERLVSALCVLINQSDINGSNATDFTISLMFTCTAAILDS